jgi:RimJ/RimL family protein N-acetyltransferase
MVIIENDPLNTEFLERMIKDPDDLSLVWPMAHTPFDHDQWKEVLNPGKGAISFLGYEGESLVGHAALDRAEDPQTRVVRFLYIIPELRSQGLGQKLMSLLEDYAREKLAARRLILRVRSFNDRAIGCYAKSGYSEFFREGSLVMMEKEI